MSEQTTPVVEPTQVENATSPIPQADPVVEPSIDPEVTPPEIAPAEEKTGAVTEEVPVEPPEPVTPTPAKSEEQVTQERLKGAIEKIQKLGEENDSALDLNAEIVADDPDFIHKIAEKNMVLANKVIQKLWGSQNIRSYKQLLDRVKLQELATTNPELYETKVELAEVKTELTTRKEQEDKETRSKFFASKNISDNEYDPNYQKVENALQYVNPDIVKKDLKKAYELAYNIAYGTSTPAPKASIPGPSVGGGTPPVPVPEVKAGPQGDTWLAQQLNQKFGYKTV